MKKLVYTLFIFIGTVLPSFAQGDKFCLGADISWATEYEARGRKFYNYQGEERETFALMKELGLDAVRLRVWVDPKLHGNWCDKNDVLAKAKRAKEQGMDVMVDFHYSDWWADPAKQNIPAAWEGHKYKQMLKDLASHTTEVLQLLKDNGITPKWVQVGNETSNGMLWSVEKDPVTGWEKKDEKGNTIITQAMGHWERNPQQYAGFFAAGYDATKKVFPDAKVIVHLDNGFDSHLYNKNLDILRDNGAKWDIIGMSIYPYWAKQSGKENSCNHLYYDMKRNIKSLVKKYGTDVMIVETGFEVDEKNPWKMEIGREQLADLIRICRDETEGHCLGIFYWEPTAKPSGYKLGAFYDDGRPTDIMRAFTLASVKASAKSADGKVALPANLKYDRPILAMETTEGTILYELYNETPQHRDNYLRLANEGLLDSVLFHRVIRDFMIQCGDPMSKTAYKTFVTEPAEPLGENNVLDKEGKEYTIPAEITYPRFFHKRGAVAAAREGDKTNPEHASASSQFYFVWGDWPAAESKYATRPMLPYYKEEGRAGTPWLDGTYTVFGQIIDGLDVVKKIQFHTCDANDRPINDVRILRLYRAF